MQQNEWKLIEEALTGALPSWIRGVHYSYREKNKTTRSRVGHYLELG